MRTTCAISLYGNKTPRDPQDPYGTAEEIEAKILETCRVTSSLGFAVLDPGEVQSLGGVLFPDAAGVIRWAAEALIDYPADFPDIHLDGHELLRRLRQAEAWDAYQAQLSWLAQRAGDTKHKILDPLIRLVQGVLKRVQTSGAQEEPYLNASPDAAFSRELAMGPGQKQVDAYRASVQKLKRRLKKLRTLKDGTAAQPKKNKPSPQKLRAQSQKTTRVLSDMHRVFDACLHDNYQDPQPPPTKPTPR